MSFLLLLILFGSTLCLTAMSAALSELSTSHLRHWARKGDPTANSLYPIKAAGSAVILTIEVLRALSLSATIVLLTTVVWPVLAWLLSAVALFVGFIVLTQLYLKPFGIRLLAMTSRPLLALTRLLKPITLPLGRVFDRFLADEPVMLTRSDLQHMIDDVLPADTDLSQDELRIISHALSFGTKRVHDIMTPRTVLTTVNETDVLSPLLLDELHKTGHSRFPVLAADGQGVAGILYLRDLLDLKTHAKVSQVMHPKVHFVNEERELDHVLQAFLRTKHHLFLAVNGFAEVVGIVTIEDVVEQILGKPIIDEFDKYDDMRAVAEAKAKIVRKQLNVVE